MFLADMEKKNKLLDARFEMLRKLEYKNDGKHDESLNLGIKNDGIHDGSPNLGITKSSFGSAPCLE